MAESPVFGVIASIALVIGALIGVRFELFEDAYERGGICRAVIGLIAGAVVFTVLSALLDRWAQAGLASQDAERQQGSAKLDTDAAAHNQSPTAASASGAAGIALLAVVTLDGIPENVALGVSLTEGTGGLTLLAAIFVSNLPESLMRARWPAATSRRSPCPWPSPPAPSSPHWRTP